MSEITCIKALCNKIPCNKDISGLENINKLYESSLTKEFIKLISTDKTISFDKYNRKDNFILISNIVLDNELYTYGKKIGEKKRKTLIKFIPTISIKEFNNNDTEWIYIFVINNMIVKIGGTRTGIQERIQSYLCGHHIKQRGKSGKCSITNAYIYNTFEFYLRLGCKIQMYGYKLPKSEITIKLFDKQTKVITQTYHIYESLFMEDYKNNNNEYPILNNNCDPKYKKDNKENREKNNNKKEEQKDKDKNKKEKKVKDIKKDHIQKENNDRETEQNKINKEIQQEKEANNDNKNNNNEENKDNNKE